MSGVDEIDERRATDLIRAYSRVHMERDTALRVVRIIRLSDEAAGYILIKHEGIISSEGMKPVEGE
jgi:hypothetical protein